MKMKPFKIKCYMADMGFSASQLAEATGISRNTISSIINGKSCRLLTASKIAKVLQVGLSDIAEE